jgi:hypothetical protein
MSPYARAKWRWRFTSPDRSRLAAAIQDLWGDLDRQINQAGLTAQTSAAPAQPTYDPCALTEPWARAAYRYLLRAEHHLADGDLQQGWIAVQAANRVMILNPRDPERAGRVAVALIRETNKLTGWRAKAIDDLLSIPKGSAPSTKIEKMNVVDAVALRDDGFNTIYFKISLRRRHLWHLFCLLCSLVALVLLLSWRDLLPDFLNDTKRIGMVVLFGALGGAISVALGLIKPDFSAKVPEQQIGAFLVWMRPTVGAAAALVAFVILQTNGAEKLLSLFHLDLKDPSILLIAFVAGFSERFIVGTIDRIAEKSSADKAE